MSELPPSMAEQDGDPPVSCCVEVRGEGEPIRIFGRRSEGITGVAYRALEALCHAFPKGLTRQQLNKATGSKDARRALQYLNNAEPWKTAQVIVSDCAMGKSPVQYRIAPYRIVWGWFARA
jgi:hypothetical protein